MCIFYWYYESNLNNQAIKGIPLTFYGLLNCIVFNTFVGLALFTHVRASFADPGYMPKEIELPDYVDTAKLKCCSKGKCKMAWKPDRAHHCSECEVCVFKVSK